MSIENSYFEMYKSKIFTMNWLNKIKSIICLTKKNSMLLKKTGLEEEFQQLLFEYDHSISFTAGCGLRAQHYIDSAHKKLKDFVKDHPQFKNRLPKKAVCQNDGTDGMSTGLATLAANNKEDCIVQ